MNQSVSNFKTIEDLRSKVLSDNTATSSVINQKPKTVEQRPSKLSERLKVTNITSSPIGNYNCHTPVPSIFNIPQVRTDLC